MAAELAPLRAEIDAAIARVLDSGVFIGGPEVAAFERELAAYTGAAHAIGVSSGTDALHVLGMALEIRPGDEVVTTPFTFFATAGAFARLGARIVFADVDPDTLCLDPRSALAACTPRTRAIVTVSLFGRPADLPEGASCPVIEDAAQSIGAHQPRGLAATLSFFPTKNLGAVGDAGAVLTNDGGLAASAALLRSHGARPKYNHVAVGGNFRLDAIQAAVLRAKLRHVARWTALRREHAAHYRAMFQATGVPPEVRLPADHPGHVYHQFVIRAPRRDALRAHLAASGIATEVYYPEPLHRQSWRSGVAEDLPIAERACREVLALPIYPSCPADHRAQVVERIREFFS
jgi:dTDP-4-amino-4,6-dideoxygalactose transaminase